MSSLCLQGLPFTVHFIPVCNYVAMKLCDGRCLNEVHGYNRGQVKRAPPTCNHYIPSSNLLFCGFEVIMMKAMA